MTRTPEQAAILSLSDDMHALRQHIEALRLAYIEARQEITALRREVAVLRALRAPGEERLPMIRRDQKAMEGRQ